MFIEVNTRASKQLALTDLILFFITSCSVKWNYWRFFFASNTHKKLFTSQACNFAEPFDRKFVLHIYAITTVFYMGKTKTVVKKIYMYRSLEATITNSFIFFIFWTQFNFILKNHVTIYLVFFLFLLACKVHLSLHCSYPVILRLLPLPLLRYSLSLTSAKAMEVQIA